MQVRGAASVGEHPDPALRVADHDLAAADRGRGDRTGGERPAREERAGPRGRARPLARERERHDLSARDGIRGAAGHGDAGHRPVRRAGPQRLARIAAHRREPVDAADLGIRRDHDHAVAHAGRARTCAARDHADPTPGGQLRSSEPQSGREGVEVVGGRVREVVVHAGRGDGTAPGDAHPQRLAVRSSGSATGRCTDGRGRSRVDRIVHADGARHRPVGRERQGSRLRRSRPRRGRGPGRR